MTPPKSEQASRAPVSPFHHQRPSLRLPVGERTVSNASEELEKLSKNLDYFKTTFDDIDPPGDSNIRRGSDPIDIPGPAADRTRGLKELHTAYAAVRVDYAMLQAQGAPEQDLEDLAYKLNSLMDRLVAFKKKFHYQLTKLEHDWFTEMPREKQYWFLQAQYEHPQNTPSSNAEWEAMWDRMLHDKDTWERALENALKQC